MALLPLLLIASYRPCLLANEGDNIALGKPYSFSTNPNYALCTDDKDILQLTDGEYVEGYFWTQRGTVGWMREKLISITIDLGKVEPIKGISFNTAAGKSSFFWPKAIYIFTSDDGTNFYYAGELIHLHEKDLPSPMEYAVYRYKTCRLETKGRYVRLTVMPTCDYMVVDEIEIYRGPNDFLGRSPGRKVDDLNKFLKENLVKAAVLKRIRRDIAQIRMDINASSIPLTTKQSLIAELDILEAERLRLIVDVGEDFRATIPLNPLHERVFKINAKLREAQGAEKLVVWKNNRWDMLSPTEIPPESSGILPELEIAMLSNEYRAEAFNITNNSKEKLAVKLKIEGLPGGSNPGYIKVHQVEFVDTREEIVIADALPLARPVSGGVEIDISAGMTRQVWFTFNPHDVEPGTYRGQVVLEPGHEMEAINLPLSFRLSAISFPDSPSLSLTMWDYVDYLTRDLTEGVRVQAIEDMREHFVDSPWASSITAPWPSSIQKVGDIVVGMEMDFTRFDNWVSDWHGARNYMIYFGDKSTFGPEGERVPYNDPRFEELVSFWVAEWAKHVKEIGLAPSQINLCLVDEPRTEEQDLKVIAWGKAIKAGAPEFVIWENPLHSEPWKANQELFNVCDVICPNLASYIDGGIRSANFYRSLRDAGKNLWVYECRVGRVGAPYSYHRLQKWMAWEMGAVGSGFWTYSSGGGTSPWNDYLDMGGRVSYSPLYFDNVSITTGKHWEAVREGVEDYEYLKILSDMVETLEKEGCDQEILNEARLLLIEAPKRVWENWTRSSIWWWISDELEDADVADIERIKILNMIESLSDLIESVSVKK